MLETDEDDNDDDEEEDSSSSDDQVERVPPAKKPKAAPAAVLQSKSSVGLDDIKNLLSDHTQEVRAMMSESAAAAQRTAAAIETLAQKLEVSTPKPAPQPTVQDMANAFRMALATTPREQPAAPWPGHYGEPDYRGRLDQDERMYDRVRSLNSWFEKFRKITHGKYSESSGATRRDLRLATTIVVCTIITMIERAHSQGHLMIDLGDINSIVERT